MFSKTSDPWPRSHYDLLEHYSIQYDKQIVSGKYQPFLYPWGALGALVVIIYLLIPHRNRPWLRKCWFVPFAWNTGFAIYSILYTKARLLAASFGLGLISAWSIAWIGTILVCNDAETDFMRIERTEGAFCSSKDQLEEKNTMGGNTDSKKRPDPSSTTMTSGHLGPQARHGEFAWQPYPLAPFIERLDWVLDIFCNFRGTGWNWRTSALPPPPKWVQEQLRCNSGAIVPKHSNKVLPGQFKTYDTRSELLRANAMTLLKGYLMLDALKTVMMWDPYFWGLVDRAPSPFLPKLLTSNPIITHTYRLALSMLGVKYALTTVFSLGPLVFSGLLGPTLLGARAEPFIYPEAWGPYSVVLDRGLAGWWSNWWHQTFRFALQQPSEKLIQVLGMNPRAPAAKLVQLVVAFGLSGALHACGSYTIAGETRPMAGSMAFFLWQAVGIYVEVTVTHAVRSTGVHDRVPGWLKRIFTFVYVHAWFYFTAHLLCDDFARGGIWLFEPVPISLFRAVGLGADRRDGWWCWSGQLLRWHSGSAWWNSGIAF